VLLSAFIRVHRWPILFALAFLAPPLLAGDFHFVILGDRTGETQPGIYQQVWKESAAEHPAFVITIGDTIQGLNDATADQEWREAQKIFKQGIALYLTPGNHDIWSDLSESLFKKYAGHPPHYSFDYQQAHFTVLDNSRTEQFSPEELAYLESDLKAHAAQPLKFIFSHKPSWLLPILLKNPQDPIHQLAKKYGVQYVVSGHIHQMIHASLEGVEYLSMPSAGGHLRASMKYEDGWFFAHTLVEVTGTQMSMHIKEIAPQSRESTVKDWGASGLSSR
jgi:UDP-2,3-diacylglucosamine pyrophosphatase LpxH